MTAYEWMMTIKAEHNLKVSEFARKCGIAMGSFKKWRAGRPVPLMIVSTVGRIFGRRPPEGLTNVFGSLDLLAKQQQKTYCKFERCEWARNGVCSLPRCRHGL